MARKVKEALVKTKDELIAAVESNWRLDCTDPMLIPEPSRFFEVGAPARVGNLQNVFIEKILFDGRAYIFSHAWRERYDTEDKTKYQAAWWMDVKELGINENVPKLMSQFRHFPALVSDIDSLLRHFDGGGLVIDPKYQRDYVWTEENKDALLDSIFERLDIGAFLFVRHQGYCHTGDKTKREYRTLDGRDVQISKEDDFTVAIVDGQQRLTTIVNFVLDRRPYKGIYFSQLHWRDQIEFLNKSVTYRIIEESNVSEKEILRMFLQANRGVPQEPEHIAKVQAMYDQMK